MSPSTGSFELSTSRMSPEEIPASIIESPSASITKVMWGLRTKKSFRLNSSLA